MKKIIIIFLALILSNFLSAQAVEIKIEGRGAAPLSEYDIKDVRQKQDKKMDKKAKNSDFEILQDQQIKEASRQAEKRKKQDERLNNALRAAVVTKAQQEALKAGINLLIDRTLGAGANKKPELEEKFDEILSQSSVYILDESYTGEVIDNDYVAKAYLTIDETEFRTLLSDLGVALNTTKTRAHSILIVLDEFFARPSDLSKNVLTKEVTTYKYDYDEKLKENEKASSSSYSNSKASGKNSSSYKLGASGGYINNSGAGGYSGYAKGANSSNYNRTSSSGSKSNYGHSIDYSQKENEFFQNIKEYDVLKPVANNLNFTQPALVEAFMNYDIRTINNDVFKSKYFKGKAISSDELANSAELAKYVEAARKDAKADFFAIGVSYIVDKGKSENTGKNTSDGTVFINVYSTQDSELIASTQISETSSGNSSDQARAMTAKKIGQELGENIARQIQNYWKKRQMYGSEYILVIEGAFLPVERIAINKSLNQVQGIKKVALRTQDSSKNEYSVNYSGDESIADAVFMKLYDSNAKFKNYDYKINGNQIIFAPLKKGTPNL